MGWNEEVLSKVFDKTGGDCHLCHKELVFRAYGKRGLPGAWCVEHSRSRALGGTDHLNNLFASCFPCNESKGAHQTAAEARARSGVSGLPMSADARGKVVASNIRFGVSGGIGAAIAYWFYAREHGVQIDIRRVLLLGVIFGFVVGVFWPVKKTS